MRLDPTNPEHMKLLNRKTRSGNTLLEEYHKQIHTKSSRQNEQILNNIFNQSDNKNSTGVTRCDSNNKVNKYRNQKIYDPDTGATFDSKFELSCWKELKLLEKAGKISDLKRQVKYELKVNNQLVCRIYPDFEFTLNGNIVTADAKSAGTQGQIFQIKRKLFKALHDREIVTFTKEMTPHQWMIKQ